MKHDDLVNSQLDAYNRLDIDDLLKTYSDEVEFREFETNQLLLRGHEEVRHHHLQKLFNCDLHAEIVSRISIGDYVFDHEAVTGLHKDTIVEAICIYKCFNGLIEKIWVKNIAFKALDR